MGRPLPGLKLWVGDRELLADAQTVPTFFRAYLGADPVPLERPWRTGDRVACDEDGYLGSRAAPTMRSSQPDLASAPFEVESALTSHPAVEEAAAVAAMARARKLDREENRPRHNEGARHQAPQAKALMEGEGADCGREYHARLAQRGDRAQGPVVLRSDNQAVGDDRHRRGEGTGADPRHSRPQGSAHDQGHQRRLDREQPNRVADRRP
jgi:hypothetical protein